MPSYPKHVAIIMDGNGRWAKKQNKPRTAGHQKGVEVVRDIAIAANKRGVEILTCYAFSTENWGRPQDEVSFLMKLPAFFFDRFMKELMDNNIRIAMIGEMDAFPEDTRNVLLRAIEKTKNNTGMILCFAMNYGGQRELVLACKELCQQVLDGTMTQQDIDNMSAQTVQNHLFTSQWPNVDLMIRTSGEMRLSNFLLWQLAYAELYFTDVAWPDFNEEELQKAFDEYARRDRRFGGV